LKTDTLNTVLNIIITNPEHVPRVTDNYRLSVIQANIDLFDGIDAKTIDALAKLYPFPLREPIGELLSALIQTDAVINKDLTKLFSVKTIFLVYMMAWYSGYWERDYLSLHRGARNLFRKYITVNEDEPCIHRLLWKQFPHTSVRKYIISHGCIMTV
jgi:hypothetical protein